MKWSASQNVTARISDFKEKREDLYYPYNDEMVDKALQAVAGALGTDVSRSNLVYNKGWFFTMQWFNPIYYKSYCRSHTVWSKLNDLFRYGLFDDLLNICEIPVKPFKEFNLIEIVTAQKLKKEEMGMICSEMNSLLRQSHAVKTLSNFGESKFKFKANFIFKNLADTIWLLGS